MKSVITVHRVNHLNLMNAAHQVSKVRKVTLEEVAHQVVVDLKETAAVMVRLVEMARLAAQDWMAFLVKMDDLDLMEDLEMMAYLVYQGQRERLVRRVEMERKAVLVHPA